MESIGEKFRRAYGMKKSVLFKKIAKKIILLLKTIFKIEFRFLRRSQRKEDRFSHQKEWINFNIKKGEKVLDIGSGSYPFPLATHLADFYEKETSHRAGPLIKDKRPFFKCNIENMPFRDKEFDFVYCSHVLEHVQNPAKACDELMRVAQRGYIETPTRTSDIMFNFTGIKDHHRWYVNAIGRTLIFIEWSDQEKKDTGIGYFFEQYHSKFKNPFQELVSKNQDFFTNMFLWENGFSYYIFDKKGDLISFKKYDGENKTIN